VGAGVGVGVGVVDIVVNGWCVTCVIDVYFGAAS